jgi:hypothetical protein
MERGKLLEPLAVQQYAFVNDCAVRRVGLVTTDDGRVGGSPDGLIVGTRGGLEVKCTLDENHMSIFADGPGDDYKQQVQGNLAICELEWWDLHAYHPELPPVQIRAYRDEPYIDKMRAASPSSWRCVNAMLVRAGATGFLKHGWRRRDGSACGTDLGGQ